MSFMLFFVLFELALSSSATVIPKIVSGRKVNVGEFPATVAIVYGMSKNHFCGGTIMDDSHIISAAHCFANARKFFPMIMVLAGDLRISPTNPSVTRQILPIKKIAMHPHFNPTTYKNDLAVISLRKKIVTNQKYAAPAILSSKTPEVGTKCYVVGWGLTHEDQEASNDLLAIEIPILETQKCVFYARDALDKFQICAGDLSGAHSPCQGDSGGPMYCEGKLTGVVSHGFSCRMKNYGETYVNVARSKAWLQYLKKKSDNSTAMDIFSKLDDPLNQSVSNFERNCFLLPVLTILLTVCEFKVLE